MTYILETQNSSSLIDFQYLIKYIENCLLKVLGDIQ